MKNTIGFLLAVAALVLLLSSIWVYTCGVSFILFGPNVTVELMSRGLDFEDWRSVFFLVTLLCSSVVAFVLWLAAVLVPLCGLYRRKFNDPHGWIRGPLERLSRLWMRAFEGGKAGDSVDAKGNAKR
jgi:hypothetical protein